MKKITIILLLIIAGCADDSNTNEQTKYEIAPELATHVESFYTEAQIHGYTFVQENLIVRSISSGTTVSRYYIDHGQRIIEVLVIDPSACEELPLFREMAHALLDKPYSSEENVIMNPDTNPCAYVHVPTGEFTSERETYLTQLFQ